jgi:hypothetical protein
MVPDEKGSVCLRETGGNVEHAPVSGKLDLFLGLLFGMSGVYCKLYEMVRKRT